MDIEGVRITEDHRISINDGELTLAFERDASLRGLRCVVCARRADGTAVTFEFVHHRDGTLRLLGPLFVWEGAGSCL